MFHHRTKTAVLGTVVAATALTGCTIDFNALPAAALSSLIPFNACEDALDYLRREAVERVGPYGLDQGGTIVSSGAPEAADSSRAPGPPTEDGSSGYSGTTNQEVGVDEADMVKTDGEFVYTVIDGTLRVTDVRAGAPDVIGELAITMPSSGGVDGPATDMMIGYGPSQLLLEGDTALVLMTQPGYGIPEGDMRMMPAPGWGGWSRSVLIAIDVSDPSNPRETARLSIDGDYLSARMIDGTARVVVRSSPSLPFEQPYSEDPDADWTELEAAATERNRQIVAESTIEQWLPSYTLESGDDETTGPLVACENLSHPVEFSGFTTVSVLTIPLDDSAEFDAPLAAAVLGDGEIVYASVDRLYVVTNRWNSGAWISDDGFVPGSEAIRAPAPETTTTGIHAFDLTGDGAATHVASGEVTGRVIGQYALSEHNGVLRVATTDGSSWGGDPSAGASESTITTLGERDGELVELGSVGGLGKGEQIYAVRYLGDTAYVVTFRQTDPLYVLDLSDPANPRETGELKITGYSSYLHPLGEDRLVGVGQEATDQGATIGLQVSLFDTSDPAAPAKLDGEVLRNAWSDAEHDPHAFLSWVPTSQIMVPVSDERRSGLLVLTVSEDGLVQDGMVTLADAQFESGMAPMRSIVVDDRLYTVWWTGIQGNDLDTLDDLGFASFN